MAKIRQSNLDPSVISGNTELSGVASDSDVLLIYDVTSGTLKKINRSGIRLNAPTLSSVSPTNVLTGDGTGNATFTITGTNFVAGSSANLITTGGATVNFDTVTLDSSTQITGVIAISSLSNANEPYDVKVTTAEGTATLTDQINIDAQPVFNTSAGSLGSFSEQTTITPIDIEAYDPDSAANVTFEIQSGALPAGLSATTVNENGVSKYRISGTLTTDRASPVTTNFTIRAVDTNSNTSSRAFSITEVPSGTESFTSSGTFSVPTGITSVDVLVVAGGGGGRSSSTGGGGGGAGGLIFAPGFPVTPGSTIPVTVGCGGGGNTTGQDSVFSTLTAKGGGGGGGNPGGSGGGNNAGDTNGGTATQPTQPGFSGAYGFGNPGTTGPIGPNAGGGGGGAGSAGTSGGQCNAASGGSGRSYTIADGTTPVVYAGGGGGGMNAGQIFAGGSGGNSGDPASPAGGGGRGGQGNNGGPNPSGESGQGNRGGGGGGSANPGGSGGSGGKGVVIVKY